MANASDLIESADEAGNVGSWISDPTGNAMNVVKVVLGVGIVTALVSVGQATVTPVIQSLMSGVPGVKTGNSNQDNGPGTRGGGL